MSAHSTVAAGRRAAEALMSDQCTVRRLTGTTVDPDTAAEVEVWTDVYAGRAKAQTYEGYEQQPEGAGHQFTRQRYSIHFPVGSFDPEPGDVAEWTACVNDPDMVGSKDRITALFNKSYATAMRVFADRGVA